MTANDTGKMPGEAELLARAIAGETTTLKPLLYLRYDPLLQHIRAKMPRFVQGLLDAEDVLQQTYTKAFRAIETFRPRDADSFHSWLKQIADNTLVDECRRLRRRKRGGDIHTAGPAKDPSGTEQVLDWIAGSDPTPSRVVARREAVKALHVAIAALPDQQREAVSLVCLQGLSAKEAVEKMGITESAVRSLVDRGRDNLREAMGSVSTWLSTR